MEVYRVYLCGGMGKFGAENFTEGNAWRVYCENTLASYEGDLDVKIINPNRYFNFIDKPPRYKSNREVMDFDLNKVRHSDLIIINFNDKYSVGSIFEMATAFERRIPIIGLNESKEKLHDWQIEACTRIFDDIDDLLDYVEDFYLS